LLLFGTPHQGIHIEPLRKIVGDGPSTRKEVVEQINGGSSFLECQREDFSNLWNSLSEPVMVSFYETRMTALPERVSEPFLSALCH
jgi:hypothetical protein